MPIYYTYALSILNTHLYNGAQIVLNKSSVITQDFWTSVQKHNVTNFGGVPYVYEMIDRLNLLPKQSGLLKHLTVAGGKLSEKLTLKMCNYCKAHGIKFYTMYGQTEATARMLVLPWDNAFDKIGSAGILIQGGYIDLIDEQKNIVKSPACVGEIVYHSKSVTMGYASSYEDLIKDDEFNGILETGDLASRDSEGFFYIKGRKSNFVKIHGKRISLLDIEKGLVDIGIDAACVQRDDFVYLFFVTAPKALEIIDSLMYDLGIPKRYYKTTALQEIPRQSSGKISYANLAQLI